MLIYNCVLCVYGVGWFGWCYFFWLDVCMVMYEVFDEWSLVVEVNLIIGIYIMKCCEFFGVSVVIGVFVVLVIFDFF